MFASEVTGQAPFAESLRAGRAVSIPYTPSFVDGIGGPHVEPAMWELSRDLLAGSVEVSLSEAASAIRLLATRNRVVAEGAAAAGVAAGLSGAVKGEKIAWHRFRGKSRSVEPVDHPRRRRAPNPVET